MITKWHYSLDTEAQRVVHAAHNISNGFYRINNFAVMPYDGKAHLDNEVTFPDLPYMTIPRFWDQVKKVDINYFPIKLPESTKQSIAKLLEQAHLPLPNPKSVQQVWDKYQNQIMTEIYKLLPSKKDSIKELEIWPTNFGTSCSFSFPKNGKVYVWLRSDNSIASIVEGILTSLTRQDVYDKLGGVWQESEIIVDFLLTYSPIATILKKIDPDFKKTLTIKSTRSIQKAELLQKSQEFTRRIGAPMIDQSLIQRIDTQTLTIREKQLLDLLVSRPGQIVTMDEIGDTLFTTNPDEFSLYAISKAVQRLRDRLEQNGISGSFIQTKRGEGYLLVN